VGGSCCPLFGARKQLPGDDVAGLKEESLPKVGLGRLVLGRMEIVIATGDPGQSQSGIEANRFVLIGEAFAAFSRFVIGSCAGQSWPGQVRPKLDCRIPVCQRPGMVAQLKVGPAALDQ
jgi:hypothetical protein